MAKKPAATIEPGMFWELRNVQPKRDYNRGAHMKFEVLGTDPKGEWFCIEVSSETLQSFTKFQRCLLSAYGRIFRHACELGSNKNSGWHTAVEAVLREMQVR